MRTALPNSYYILFCQLSDQLCVKNYDKIFSLRDRGKRTYNTATILKTPAAGNNAHYI